MNRNALVKRVAVAGGFAILCAAPGLGFGQSSPSNAAPPRVSSAAQPYPAMTDLLSGLTLTDDQKAKINQVREDVRSRLAAVAGDKKLGTDVKDAMVQGYMRIENTEILEVLTPEQQAQVRKRMSDWRASQGQGQQQSQRSRFPQAPRQAK